MPKNNSFFPKDFFGPNIDNQQKIKEEINPRSIYVNLQKEYDEDRELLELLRGTNKSKIDIKIFFIKQFSWFIWFLLYLYVF